MGTTLALLGALLIGLVAVVAAGPLNSATVGAAPRETAPEEGFESLFNGRDLTGWHARPEVLENWFVEDGVLKSTTLVEHYRASLLTKKHYRDFVLMLEFRMPTISDSGINFRRLIPEIPGFGNMEQFNLRSRGGMGQAGEDERAGEHAEQDRRPLCVIPV